MARSPSIVESLYPLVMDAVNLELKAAMIGILVSEHGCNASSASYYVVILGKMLAGEVYKRALNKTETDVFLSHILADFGPAAFENAVSALRLHIEYRDSIHQNLPSLKSVLAKYSTSAAHVTGHQIGGSAKATADLRSTSMEMEAKGDFNAFGLEDERAKVLRLIAARQGGSKFRNQLLTAYGRCAVTGTQTHEVLEAAHIVPYLGETTDDIRNGLLLRCDIHTLFDLLMFTILDDYTILVVEKLKATRYGKYAGKQIRLPADPLMWPSKQSLKHHRLRFGLTH